MRDTFYVSGRVWPVLTRARVSAGQTLPLAFNMSRMHVFDPQTETALV